MSQEKNQHLMIVITIVSTVVAGTGVYFQWLDRNAKQAQPTVQVVAPAPSMPQVVASPNPTVNLPTSQVNNKQIQQVSDLTVQALSAPQVDTIVNPKKTAPATNRQDEFSELPPLSQDLDMPDLKMGKDDF